MMRPANDNETDDESERAKRLRTIARLCRKGDMKPFDIVKSEPGEKHEGRSA